MGVPFNVFIFCDSLSWVNQDVDLIARVPTGLSTRNELFDVLNRELSLPSYFGRNWDALSDCLRDLSWIPRRRVIIVHEAVPELDPAALKGYLNVLLQCAMDWKPHEEHELLVVFPEDAEAEVRDVTSDLLT